MDSKSVTRTASLDASVEYAMISLPARDGMDVTVLYPETICKTTIVTALKWKSNASYLPPRGAKSSSVDAILVKVRNCIR